MIGNGPSQKGKFLRVQSSSQSFLFKIVGPIQCSKSWKLSFMDKFNEISCIFDIYWPQWKMFRTQFDVNVPLNILEPLMYLVSKYISNFS